MSMINSTGLAVRGGVSGLPANGDKNVSAAMEAATKMAAQTPSTSNTAPVAQPYADTAGKLTEAEKNQKREDTRLQNDFKRLDRQVTDTLNNARNLATSVNNKLASSTHPRKQDALDAAQKALTDALAASKALEAVRGAAVPTEQQIKDVQTAFDTAITSYRNADALATVARVNENFINRLFNRMVNATFQDNDGNMVGFEEHLNNTIDELGTGDSSSPQKLARYQKAIMQFTVHTNATSSMVKSISDLDKGVIRDFN